MTTGSTIKGPWPVRELQETEELVLSEMQSEEPEQAWYYEEEEEPAKPRRFGRTLIKTLCGVSAIAWVGFAGWTQYVAAGANWPTAQQWLDFAPIVAAPLIGIGLIWHWVSRSPAAESERIERTINDLRAEEARFGLIIDSFAEKLDGSRQAIVEQNDLLMQLGHESAQKMAHVADSMRQEVESIAKHSSTLKSSAASARADMAVLLADLPRANVQTRQITAALQKAGLEADDSVSSLDAKLVQLAEHGREADAVAKDAAQKLASHLARMEGVSETAGQQMTLAANEMTEAVDGALNRAADALTSARQGMGAQGEAMLAMIEQGQAAMARVGAEATETINQRMTEISARVDMIAQSFSEQDVASQAMLARVTAEIQAIEDRIGSLNSNAQQTSEQASVSMAGLDDQLSALSRSLDAGKLGMEAMLGRSEALLTALDATTREIDETLPASHERFVQVAREAASAAQTIAPQFEAIELSSANALARLHEAESLLSSRQDAIQGTLDSADARLSSSKASVEELSQHLADFDDRAKALADATGPQLIDALLRVKETANQAVEHARNAIQGVIPETAQAFSAQAKDALQSTLSAQVEQQIQSITATAETAVKSAQKATDKLMRQMLTISETANDLENRVKNAKEDIENVDDSSFARSVSLLIESLNSTAIDVTKIMSNEVTDTAWAAYLRGDRGVFTRRAVRLLDTSDVKEVTKYYDSDVEFRDQVNRYIRDFETMIRHVLATRAGGPLSVTLLSSDAGKLYVALAQAIDRLRT